MAREYAQIRLSIWTEDDDWQDLSALARYLYLSLVSSPTLNYAGVADWRPKRIGKVNGMTESEIETAGAELAVALYLVIDESTDEVLVRSFIRGDGIMKQPKMAVAMASAYKATVSRDLRAVIVHELIRLREDCPDLSGWNAPKAFELLGMRSVDPSSYPFGKGIGNPIAKGSPTPVPIPVPNTAPPITSEIASDPDASTRDDVDRLCKHLANRIAEDGSKRPSIGKTWTDAARLLLDRDGRTEADVHLAIDWAQDHAFWRANILSMPTLRQRYDQLRKQAAAEAAPTKSRRQEETDGLFERAAQRMGITPEGNAHGSDRSPAALPPSQVGIARTGD